MKMWAFFLTHFMGSAQLLHEKSQENYKKELWQVVTVMNQKYRDIWTW